MFIVTEYAALSISILVNETQSVAVYTSLLKENGRIMAWRRLSVRLAVRKHSARYPHDIRRNFVLIQDKEFPTRMVVPFFLVL